MRIGSSETVPFNTIDSASGSSVTVWASNAIDSQIATTGVLPNITPLRTIVSVTGLPVCGSPIDSAWLSSNCAHRFVGPDEETVCDDDEECAGEMRPKQMSATQHIPANNARPRWFRAFIAGRGRTLWVYLSFTGLRVLDNRGTPCRIAVRDTRDCRDG